jgi:glycosyltransferase involved in cell wall biosynthesis
MVAGKAIVSTPYLHAQELLGDGRGMLVPFRDASAIAQSAGQLLRDKTLRRQLEQRAWHCGREMTWHAVAERYVHLFHQVAARPSARSTAAVTFAPEPALTAWHVAVAP